MQYFSQKKLILPQGYFINSSQVPTAKDLNRLLVNSGCESFPTQKISLAIKNSNFFFAIQNESKNKLYGFVRVTSDRGLNANLWNLCAEKVLKVYYFCLKDFEEQFELYEFPNY